MAKLAVLASGNGSNFEALATAARAAGHELCLLVCDRPEAYAFERARRLSAPAALVPWKGRPREEAEAALEAALEAAGADVVALAGFMRLLSPAFVARRRGRLVNVHPSLLPAWPGAHAIERAWEAGAAEFGVSVHYVDEGMDTGPLLAQERVARAATLEATEAAVHELEHRLYPRVVVGLLDGLR